MKSIVQWTYGLAAGALLAVPSGVEAQFVAATNYPPAYQQSAPGYPTAATPSYVTPPAQGAIAPPSYGAVRPGTVQPAPAGYAAVPTPAYAAPPASAQRFAAPNYGAPAYAAPRVAQAAELPAPSEAVGSVAPEIAPAPMAPSQPAPSAMTYGGSYTQPTNHVQPSYSAPVNVSATSGCATGNCGSTYNAAPAPAMSYGYGGCNTGSCSTGGCATGSCATGACGGASYAGTGYESCYAPAAPACDLGYGTAAPARKRQWFAGVYGLFLDRADGYRQQVAYFTDTAGFAPGTPYYYQPADASVWSTDPGTDGQFGAEVRFGSTFGCDPCACGQPFAWEVGYWALDDDTSSSVFAINEPIGPTAGYTDRLYGTIDYSGLRIDLDGAGATYTERAANEYTDYGVPADGDVNANNIRLLGVRVRQRFQVQNLELNFWRFGTPAAAPGLGGGGRLGAAARGAFAGGAGAGGYGAGSCGVGSGCDSGCGPVACAPCRPPRRFFINGVAGLRYFRVDDDFGADYRFTIVDGAGDPQAGMPTQYDSFPADDFRTLMHDIETDNQLVGFQLGCSMNWLVGCNWNFFCDSNFGIYGNQIDVYQRVYGGGTSEVTQYNGGGAASYNASDNDIAFLGEIRAGAGYQVSCNCRLTAAYRFIGVGGLALAVDQIPTAGYANANAVQYVNSNQSIVLHGLQTGVEWKY